ncbi:MAG: hypothetical protein AAF943_18150 [Pseudomonadota bacterium]
MSEGQDTTTVAVGMAGLSLLEALILTLREKGAVTDDELDCAFDAAIAAHDGQTGEYHAAAALLLRKLQVEGNSVRLP